MSRDFQVLGTIESGVPRSTPAGAAVLPEAALQRLAALVDMALGDLSRPDDERRSGVRVSVYASSGSPIEQTIACADARARGAAAPTPSLPADVRSFVLLPMTDADGVVLDPLHAAVKHLALWVSCREPRQWGEVDLRQLATVAAAAAAEIRVRAEFVALERIAEGMRRYSLRDPLTEVANRELLVDRLGQAVLRASRHHGQPFALFSLTLDQFADIEATLGYEAADDVLATVARRLEPIVRGIDTVARLGADEFALLLDGVGGDGDAANVAGRIRDALLAPMATRWNDTVIVSPSIGIVLSTSGTDSASRLIQLAGMARARARESGTGFEFFEPVMQERAQGRLRKQTELRRAIETDEFELHYQPVISLETGRITQLEALLRWRHPKRGLLAAADFVPLAEETGVIVPMGWWVFAEACPQLAEWRRRFGPDIGLTISVNVGPVHLAQRDVVSRIETVLNASGLPAASINVEVTENALIIEPDRTRATLEDLRSLGVAIHLDDFGSGYSSLRYLQELPLDSIKIDRAFITPLTRGSRQVRLVATIRELAGQIGASVVAEGVETPEQLELVRQLKCEYAQGYLIGKPMPVAQIESLLAAGHALTPSAWLAAIPESNQRTFA